MNSKAWIFAGSCWASSLTTCCHDSRAPSRKAARRRSRWTKGYSGKITTQVQRFGMLSFIVIFTSYLVFRPLQGSTLVSPRKLVARAFPEVSTLRSIEEGSRWKTPLAKSQVARNEFVPLGKKRLSASVSINLDPRLTANKKQRFLRKVKRPENGLVDFNGAIEKLKGVQKSDIGEVGGHKSPNEKTKTGVISLALEVLKKGWKWVVKLFTKISKTHESAHVKEPRVHPTISKSPSRPHSPNKEIFEEIIATQDGDRPDLAYEMLYQELKSPPLAGTFSKEPPGWVKLLIKLSVQPSADKIFMNALGRLGIEAKEFKTLSGGLPDWYELSKANPRVLEQVYLPLLVDCKNLLERVEKYAGVKKNPEYLLGKISILKSRLEEKRNSPGAA